MSQACHERSEAGGVTGSEGQGLSPDAGVRRDAQCRRMSRSLEPTEGRQLYGQNPVTYALGRPDYPERAYELLASRCGLAGATRVIEVGPGTGLVTRRLLGAGAHVTGIEPNTAMSAYLSRTIADPQLDVLVDAFEDVDLSPDSFDLAVAATSFHWVSQPAGMRQLRRLLCPGGWVAIWWMLFDDPGWTPRPLERSTHRWRSSCGFPRSSRQTCSTWWRPLSTIGSADDWSGTWSQRCTPPGVREPRLVAPAADRGAARSGTGVDCRAPRADRRICVSATDGSASGV
jgi:SAM-dependent methyltransferase